MLFEIDNKEKRVILALGAESAGNFSVFSKGKVFLSEDFGDLLEEENFTVFKKAVLLYLEKNKIKPDVVVADLHPLYVTTVWGKELAEEYGAEFAQVQHHVSHIMSAVGDKYLGVQSQPLPSFIGIACDGTGYGLDGGIWGGEIFSFQEKIKTLYPKPSTLNPIRIGHLENQTMIGGDLAVKEPARMLISILDKFSIFNFQFSNKSQFPNFQTKKEFIYDFVKKFYTKQEFEVLYNQLQQGFNCQETSSTGRVLDAVAVLLGFAGNERKYKHEATGLLEDASEGAEPYDDIKPFIVENDFIQNPKSEARNPKQIQNSKYEIQNKSYVLLTTPLFEYLIEGLAKGKDKKKLAITAQLYIAKGLWKIVSTLYPNPSTLTPLFFSGGMANNKIMSEYLEPKGAYLSKKVPRGDAGLSFGQIIHCLYNEQKGV